MISIIIPVWSDAFTLPFCLENCVKVSDDIVVILEPDQLDDSKMVCKEYASRYPNIKVINNEKRLGVLKCRQLGLSHAKNTKVLFIDADDVLVDDFKDKIPELCELASIHGKVHLNMVELWGDLSHIRRDKAVDPCHALIDIEVYKDPSRYADTWDHVTEGTHAFHLFGVKPEWRLRARGTDLWYGPNNESPRSITTGNPRSFLYSDIYGKPKKIDPNTYPNYPTCLMGNERFKIRYSNGNMGDSIIDYGEIPDKFKKFKFSCICVTYGRDQCIGEAVRSFLDQTYENKELIILNTCPRQKYIFKHPQVKVVNLEERPKSHCMAMHMGVLETSGDWIVPWDDDDIWLPEFLSQYASYIEKDSTIGWVQPWGRYLAGVDKVSSYASRMTYQHLFTVSRKLYDKVGGYLNPGYFFKYDICDRNLGDAIRKYKGINIVNGSYNSSMIYRRGMSYHHSAVSYGKTQYESCGDHVNKLLDSGKIRSGIIEIDIREKYPWAEMAKKKFTHPIEDAGLKATPKPDDIMEAIRNSSWKQFDNPMIIGDTYMGGTYNSTVSFDDTTTADGYKYTVSDGCIMVNGCRLKFDDYGQLMGKNEKTSTNVRYSRIPHKTEPTKSEIPASKINLYVQTYKSENPKRQKELDACLAYNKSLGYINVIELSKQDRLTFKEMMDFIRPLSNDDTISIFANSDIAFDESIKSTLDMVSDECFWLTRYDKAKIVNGVLHNEKTALHRISASSDVWVFRGVLKNMKDINFGFGIMACDVAFASRLRKANYAVFNPCHSIKTYHIHDSDFRTNQYPKVEEPWESIKHIKLPWYNPEEYYSINKNAISSITPVPSMTEKLYIDNHIRLMRRCREWTNDIKTKAWVSMGISGNDRYSLYEPMLMMWDRLGYKTIITMICDENSIEKTKYGIILKLKGTNIDYDTQTKISKFYASSFIEGMMIISDTSIIPIQEEYFDRLIEMGNGEVISKSSINQLQSGNSRIFEKRINSKVPFDTFCESDFDEKSITAKEIDDTNGIIIDNFIYRKRTLQRGEYIYANVSEPYSKCSEKIYKLIGDVSPMNQTSIPIPIEIDDIHPNVYYDDIKLLDLSPLKTEKITAMKIGDLFKETGTKDVIYLAFPWAAYKLNNTEVPIIKLPPSKHVITVCQHINFRSFIPDMKKLGITVLFTPHATLREPYIGGIRILGYPIFPNVTCRPLANEEQDILFSFLGMNTHPYRAYFFNMYKDDPNVKRRNAWHFWLPKDEQDKNLTEYRDYMSRSKYTLCLLGSGPSSIRIFECLVCGSVPVIIADELKLPTGINWGECSIRINQSDARNIPKILSSISDERFESLRKSAIKHGEMLMSDFVSPIRLFLNQVKNPVWMEPAEIDLIESYLKSQHSVLEWGSGGSTLRFAPHVKRYVSVEHNEEWYNKIKPLATSADIHLCKVDHKVGTPADIVKFKDYISYPASLNEKFDRILIDGRCRARCAFEVLDSSLLKENGLVFIHDWCRERYHRVLNAYDVVKVIQSTSTNENGIAVLRPKNTENMHKIKAFALVTPSHAELLNDFLIPSLPKDMDLIVSNNEQHCESGEYMSKGWNTSMCDKVKMIIEAINSNIGECILHIDVDIQFFTTSISSHIMSALRDIDFVAMNDNIKGGVACGGFFAMRCSDETLKLFEDVLKLMNDSNINDQDALNDVLPKSGVKYGFLDDDKFWSPRKLWTPNKSLKIPDTILMHHANWCVGVDSKRAQLKKAMEAYSRNVVDIEVEIA